jgi:hypothetical protein
MKSIDFCYWLQGWFELFEPPIINQKQIQTIQEHLSLVYQYDKEIIPFCAELQGLLLFVQPVELDAATTQKIKNRLNETFLKQIDSRYTPQEHAALNAIHKPEMFTHEWMTTDDNGNKLPPRVFAKC